MLKKSSNVMSKVHKNSSSTTSRLKKQIDPVMCEQG